MSQAARRRASKWSKPSVSVVGGGSSGQTMAADLALRGFAVTLCGLPRFGPGFEHLLTTKRIEKHGALESRGPIGLASLAEVTADVAAGIRGADIVAIAVPAYAHQPVFEVIADVLEDGQLILIVPGNWGALRLHRLLAERTDRREVTVAETDVCMHFCRAAEPWLGQGKVRVIAESDEVHIAAIPAADTPTALERAQELFPQLSAASSVLETSTGNSNIVVHGPLVLMNAGWIEHTSGQFMIYRDGVTPAVGRVIDAVWRERDAIAAGLGVPVPSREPYYEVIRRSAWVHDPAETGPPHLRHRYLSEDIPYGLVPLVSLGRLVQVSTPVCDALVDLASIASAVDYRQAGLSLEKLGLAGLTPEGVRRVCTSGLAAEPPGPSSTRERS